MELIGLGVEDLKGTYGKWKRDMILGTVLRAAWVFSTHPCLGTALGMKTKYKHYSGEGRIKKAWCSHLRAKRIFFLLFKAIYV